MNREGNNKRGGARPNTGKTPTNRATAKSKPAMPKRAQGKKAAPTGNIDATKPAAKPKPAARKTDEIRLNKYIANSGICSRRDADIYIQSGNVKVNGVAVTEMGYKVQPGDVVNFDGAVLTPGRKEYILLNKPKNFTTAADDGAESRNVLDLVRAATDAKLTPIGRMDKNTTGLLLLTNDNDMVTKFTQSSQRSSKIYQVSLDKNLKYEDLEKISKGPIIDEHKVFVEEVSYIEDQPKSEVGLKLKTSNIKVVRNIFEHFGYDVLRIDRVAFAGLTKKNLPRGNWRFLTEQEIINLKNS